jgi:DNA-binding transcriptional MocR family regulator
MMAAFAADFRDGTDINLGVGYVNERTIPVSLLSEAMEAVARDGATYHQAFNYGGPEGSANLIAAIRRFLVRMRVGGLTEQVVARKRLIVGACGATSILDAIANVMAPGIVITADPMYYIYSDALERKGFEVLAVPEDSEGLDARLLENKLQALGDRVRDISFFYVVTVNNPSATILSNARRRELYEIAARLSREQGRQIPIFYDLAYELLRHDPETQPFQSVLSEDVSGIAYEIGTLSKLLAPALRIGYLMGPDGSFMNAMVQNTSDAGFSAPLFVQEMSAYLLDRHVEAQLAAVNAGYREKAVAVRAAIERELGPLLAECRGGQAGFYFYLTFGKLETHPESRFFRYLTRTTGDPALDGPSGNPLPRVLYIPGVYCVHPKGDLAEAGGRAMRFSYGYEDTERILEALAFMRCAAASSYVGVR